MDVRTVFSNTVEKHGLIDKNDRILVGLSGGADSVSLIHLLSEMSEKYGITVGAAHINHQLRATADRDMNFCVELCKKLNIRIDVLTVDVKAAAKKESISEELCARNIRYDFFESLGYDKIATAHNKNDNAETILFNFMRGASTGGLCGIPYRRQNIIRPLLDVKKEDIIGFCTECGYDFVTDETNYKELYTRNKIRLSLIPEIERTFNANFVNTVTANSELIFHDESFLSDEAKKRYTGEILSEYTKEIAPAILFRMIEIYCKERMGSNQNLSAYFVKQIVSLLEKDRTGAKIDLPCGFEAYTSYGKLIVDKKKENTCFEYDIIPEEPLFVPEISKIITLKADKNGKISLPDTEGLSVRSKRDGDIFFPSGMNGKKRLSDYFTDKKIPRDQRCKIPILTKNGDIVAIVNHRIDRRFCGNYGCTYSISVKEAENAE